MQSMQSTVISSFSITELEREFGAFPSITSKSMTIIHSNCTGLLDNLPSEKSAWTNWWCMQNAWWHSSISVHLCLYELKRRKNCLSPICGILANTWCRWSFYRWPNLECEWTERNTNNSTVPTSKSALLQENCFVLTMWRTTRFGWKKS